jgi:hypothetical protein
MEKCTVIICDHYDEENDVSCCSNREEIHDPGGCASYRTYRSRVPCLHDLVDKKCAMYGEVPFSEISCTADGFCRCIKYTGTLDCVDRSNLFTNKCDYYEPFPLKERKELHDKVFGTRENNIPYLNIILGIIFFGGIIEAIIIFLGMYMNAPAAEHTLIASIWLSIWGWLTWAAVHDYLKNKGII